MLRRCIWKIQNISVISCEHFTRRIHQHIIFFDFIIIFNCKKVYFPIDSGEFSKTSHTLTFLNILYILFNKKVGWVLRQLIGLSLGIRFMTQHLEFPLQGPALKSQWRCVTISNFTITKMLSCFLFVSFIWSARKTTNIKGLFFTPTKKGIYLFFAIIPKFFK